MGTRPVEAPVVLAVLASDAHKFGCPHCGGIFGSSPISGGGSQVWQCADCSNASVYLADGLEKSTIGISGQYAEVSPHPRRDRPVDREKLLAEHKTQIEAVAFVDLQHWLLLGHGQPARIEKVGSHWSSSHGLPIIASDCPSGVRATWFGNNYYFYFLGVELRNPIPATLLYPISGMFGSYALSGHVNTEVAPPITNFQKLYHNCAPMQRFGGECGSDGLQAALVLRYLEAVSKLDVEGILEVCLRKTRYGNTDVIDGNGIDFDALVKLLGIEGGRLYHEQVTNAPSNVFEGIALDWFGTKSGGKSAVEVRMQEGVILPSMRVPAEISLDPKDTGLGSGVSGVLKRIPIQWLDYRHDEAGERHRFFSRARYQPHWAYQRANLGTRDFVFHTPNVLDSALTTFFLMKVLAPVLQTVQESKQY